MHQYFGDGTECTNYYSYHRYFYIQLVFQFSSKVYIFIALFAFLQFYPVISWNGEVNYLAGSLFLLFITRPGRLVEIRWSIIIILTIINSILLLLTHYIKY